MATFTASAPVNLLWRGPSGTWYELANGSRHAREPIPAGEAWTIADADADAFEEAFGDPPVNTGPPRGIADVGGWDLEPIQQAGRIPGLTRQ